MSLRDKTILVVDDAPDARLVLATVLHGLGRWSVPQAGDGEEALDWLGGDCVDAVIVDCHMECIDGLEFTRRFRAMGATKPVLMLSGFGDAALASAARAAGADACLSKPVSARALAEALRELFEPPGDGSA